MARGLLSRFNLKNGRFELTEGSEKASDDIWFYCIFNKNRIYLSDFGANFVTLTQKPADYLISNRTILLGSLKKGIQKYVNNVTVDSIDIGYTSTNRRDYSMLIEYTAIQEDTTKVKGVMFV